MAFGRRFRGIVERLHAEKEAKKVESRRGTTAAPNERRAREALGGDCARPFPVAGGVPALNERAQPLPLVGGEVSVPGCSGNLGDVAQHAVFPRDVGHRGSSG
jgi:hypothetical protein